MPCSDVTEHILVVVDDEDRLKSYEFTKRTCGQGVGAAGLLQEILGGMRVEAILAITPDAFVHDHPVAEPIEEFLGLKHLIAVQSALEVLVGTSSGGPDAICAAAEISFEDGETVIFGRIAVDLVTEKISSCGACRGCGKERKAKKKVVFN